MRYFEIFHLTPKFVLAKNELEKIEEFFLKNYKNPEQGVIDLASKGLKEAYEVLKNDIKRAEYILKSLDIDIHSIKMPADLVEYILEAREDIETSDDETEIKSKVRDVEFEAEEALELLNEELEDHLSQGKFNKEVVCELFSKFKCLAEIVRKYKKRAV